MKIGFFAAFAVTVLAGATQPAVADARDDQALATGYATHLLDLVNQYRQRHQLPPLVSDARLAALAQEHTHDMARDRRASHAGFSVRFDRANSELCVENVGWNFPHAEGQLDGWRGSPGHNRNLLDSEVTHAGIAVYRGYVTFFACA